jgi:hypothetical protein
VHRCCGIAYVPPSCCLCSNAPPTSLGNCVAIGRSRRYTVSHTFSVLAAHKNETIDVSTSKPLLVSRCTVEATWKVMARAQKPDFVFRRNGRVYSKRRGRQFSRLLAADVCASAVLNAGYIMFRGSVKGTGYPLHSPVSPSLPPSRASPCAITFQLESTTVKIDYIYVFFIFLLRSPSHFRNMFQNVRGNNNKYYLN